MNYITSHIYQDLNNGINLFYLTKTELSLFIADVGRDSFTADSLELYDAADDKEELALFEIETAAEPFALRKLTEGEK